MHTRGIGDKGEEAAVEYLEKNGYKIIKRNFHFGKVGEIDVIAEINGIMVFVEVRSKTSKNTINPLLTLSRGKIQKIRKTAQGYLFVNKIENQMCRLDFMSVDFTTSADEPTIEHRVNAF